MLALLLLAQMWNPSVRSAPLTHNAPTQLLTFGDSKSMNGAGGNVCRPLESLTYWEAHPVTCTRLAKSGYTAALWQADIDADLAGIATVYADILVNLGANDVVVLPAEATWKANMGYVLDALHAWRPVARIFVARVWRTAEVADCDTLDGWIGDLVATRPWAILGVDERTFLEAVSTDVASVSGVLTR